MLAEPFQNSHVHHSSGAVHAERRFFVYGGRSGNDELNEQGVWELTVHGDLGSDSNSKSANPIYSRSVTNKKTSAW